MATATFKKPKALVQARGHAQFASLLASPDFKTNADGEAIVYGLIPQPKNIPSPYRYASDWEVYVYQGTPVVLAETSYRRFEVFRVSDCIYDLPC